MVAGETRMIGGTTLGLICIAIISAWWPAYRAAELKVVEALRHV
jgi:putative ABC transport system permease protein